VHQRERVKYSHSEIIGISILLKCVYSILGLWKMMYTSTVWAMEKGFSLLHLLQIQVGSIVKAKRKEESFILCSYCIEWVWFDESNLEWAGGLHKVQLFFQFQFVGVFETCSLEFFPVEKLFPVERSSYNNFPLSVFTFKLSLSFPFANDESTLRIR